VGTHRGGAHEPPHVANSRALRGQYRPALKPGPRRRSRRCVSIAGGRYVHNPPAIINLCFLVGDEITRHRLRWTREVTSGIVRTSARRDRAGNRLHLPYRGRTPPFRCQRRARTVPARARAGQSARTFWRDSSSPMPPSHQCPVPDTHVRCADRSTHHRISPSTGTSLRSH